jgi:hypothetical protein
MREVSLLVITRQFTRRLSESLPYRIRANLGPKSIVVDSYITLSDAAKKIITIIHIRGCSEAILQTAIIYYTEGSVNDQKIPLGSVQTRAEAKFLLAADTVIYDDVNCVVGGGELHAAHKPQRES